MPGGACFRWVRPASAQLRSQRSPSSSRCPCAIARRPARSSRSTRGRVDARRLDHADAHASHAARRARRPGVVGSQRPMPSRCTTSTSARTPTSCCSASRQAAHVAATHVRQRRGHRDAVDPAQDPDYTSYWPAGTTVNAVNITGGTTAVVDLSAQAANGPAGKGAISAQQLLYTIIASAPKIDGSAVAHQRHAGHVAVGQPVGRHYCATNRRGRCGVTCGSPRRSRTKPWRRR